MTGTLFSFPPAKNARFWPSGDQNGYVASRGPSQGLRGQSIKRPHPDLTFYAVVHTAKGRGNSCRVRRPRVKIARSRPISRYRKCTDATGSVAQARSYMTSAIRCRELNSMSVLSQSFFYTARHPLTQQLWLPLSIPQSFFRDQPKGVQARSRGTFC